MKKNSRKEGGRMKKRLFSFLLVAAMAVTTLVLPQSADTVYAARGGPANY